MAHLPRIVVEAFEQTVDGPDAPRRPLGPQDLTEQVLALLVRHGRLPSDGVAIVDIHRGLAPDVAEIAWAGNVALPGLAEATASFVRDIGGIGAIGHFREHLGEIRSARYEVVLAREVLSKVAVARVGAMPGPDAMMRDPYARGDGFEVFAELRDGRWMRDHDRANPEPGGPFAEVRDKAWEEWRGAREAARRRAVPPFAFATRDIVWAGIDPRDVRAAFDDEGEVDVESLLDSGMEEHHEDARDHVVDEAGLFRIVASWLPHAGKGTAEDLALEARLSRWNARQTLSSYEEDPAAVVPTFPDAGREEFLAFAEREVSAAEARLAALEGGWEPRAPLSTAA